MIRRTLVVGSAAVVLIAACGVAHQTDLNSAPAAQSGSPRVLEPSQVQTQVAGRPAAYLFTATSCESCVAAVKAMQTAARDHGGVQFVGVDMFSADSPADISAWLQANGLSLTMLVWTIDKDGSLTTKFGVTSLETSVLVGSSGQIRFVNHGGADPALLAKQLAQLT